MALSLVQVALVAQLISFGLASMQVTTNLAETDNLEGHLMDLFSMSRDQQSGQEYNRIQNEIRRYFENLINSVPADLRSRMMVMTHNYSEPSSNGRYNGTNILLVIKGSNIGTSDDQVSLVGAHYDTARNTTRTTPGVNDNGSGMAALLEIARVLSTALAEERCSFHNTIIIAAFDQEELGLIGSYAFMTYLDEQLLPSFGTTTFQGAYILETMMNFDPTENSQTTPTGFNLLFPEVYSKVDLNNFRGDFLATILRQDDVFLANLFDSHWYQLVGGNFSTTPKYRHLNITIARSGDPLSWPDYNFYFDLYRSDHFPFWRNGFKAVQITDTADFRGYMRNCYHSPCDDESRITEDNLEFLRIATDTVIRSVVVLASGNGDVQCLYLSSDAQRINFSLIIMTFMTLLHLT